MSEPGATAPNPLLTQPILPLLLKFALPNMVAMLATGGAFGQQLPTILLGKRNGTKSWTGISKILK